MPWSVYVKWQDYFQRDPFNENWMGVRLGYAVAGLANLVSGLTYVVVKGFGGRGKRVKFKPKDFMPKLQQKRKYVSPNDMFTKMLTATKLLGGKVIDKRGRKD